MAQESICHDVRYIAIAKNRSPDAMSCLANGEGMMSRDVIGAMLCQALAIRNMANIAI